jgi:hypothetical protein
MMIRVNSIVITLLSVYSISVAQEWMPPVRISQPGCYVYPQLIANGDTLHAVYTVSNGPVDLFYIRSIDGGYSWSQPQGLSYPRYEALFPKIIRWQNNLMVLWDNDNWTGHPRENIGFSISTNSGESWTPPSYVLTQELGIYIYGASNNDSIVNLVLSYGLAGPDIYAYNIRSTDFGQSWSNPVQIYHPWYVTGSCDQISVGNTVHFCWSAGFFNHGITSFFHARSTDGGLTWLENFNINNGESWDQYPSIAKSRYGDLAVMWINGWTLSTRISIDSGATWQPTVEMMSETAQPFVLGDIAWDDRSICVVWEDERFGGINERAIFFNRSSDNGQTWGDEVDIDRDISDSWNPSLAITKSAYYVIWYDGRDDEEGSCGLYFSRYPYNPDNINDDEPLIPDHISMTSYPNPFNSSTIIRLKDCDMAEINIFDILGHRAARLPVRNGSTVWDATGYPSGLYFARAEINGKIESIKLTLLK